MEITHNRKKTQQQQQKRTQRMWCGQKPLWLNIYKGFWKGKRFKKKRATQSSSAFKVFDVQPERWNRSDKEHTVAVTGATASLLWCDGRSVHVHTHIVNAHIDAPAGKSSCLNWSLACLSRLTSCRASAWPPWVVFSWFNSFFKKQL